MTLSIIQPAQLNILLCPNFWWWTVWNNKTHGSPRGVFYCPEQRSVFPDQIADALHLIFRKHIIIRLQLPKPLDQLQPAIARVLYLCKDVETFGSGIRKIYSLCNTAGVEIKYENADTDFKIEFSRIDRNKSPLSSQENGRINDYISDLEQAVLSCLREEPGMTNAELIVKTGNIKKEIYNDTLISRWKVNKYNNGTGTWKKRGSELISGNKLATEDQKGKRHGITERKNRLKTHKT